MTEDQPPADQPLGLSFGSVAQAYDRGRPGYPEEAVAWLLDGEAKVVLELGAGTGKLTADLVAGGHAVYATEPDEAMLAVLQERVPDCSARLSGAEEIPANDRTVDVVVAAQAFHWFALDRALPEIARVLKPGGHLSLVWNTFDQRIPWVRRLVAVMGERPDISASIDALDESDLFGDLESEVFTHWQDVNRDSLVDVVASRSWVAALPEAERGRRLAAVRELYDDYGRGHDGMQLPYRTECFRATVIDQDSVPGSPSENSASAASASEGGPFVSDGTDTDTLLIDFR